VYFNSSKNSRGVAVLISKQVEHEIIATVADPQENVLLLRLKIRNVEIALGAVQYMDRMLTITVPTFLALLVIL
jgi:hypothetical protein